MKLIEVTDPNMWEAFQCQHPWAQFTQSWTWGEFRRSSVCDVRRMALVDDEGKWLVAAQLEYRRKLPGIGYWFAPRGPVFRSGQSSGDDTHLLGEFIHNLVKVEFGKALFIRLEPVIEEGKGELSSSARRTASLNPSCTLLLELVQTEEELLTGMHPKTRYNIRVAERHGLKVRVTDSAADRETFFKLMDETSTRDRFVQHDRAYLEATLKALMAAGMGRLRFAEHDGKVLAASVEVLYGDTLTYLYGASSSESRQLMAPFILHWQAIQEAKREGYRFYDFWGINPESKTSWAYKPSWEGITLFKRRWGGREVFLVGTWDLPRYPRLYQFIFHHR